MHKLIFISFLLIVSNSLKAADLPKLNLEIGKKYSIETIYLQDTSKTNPRREYDKKIYEFVPTSFNKNEGSYELKMMISYFFHTVQEINKSGVWTEKEVYETGYVTTHRNPIVYMNMFKVPVIIKITDSSKIISFDFGEYNKTKTPEGLLLNLGEWDQKSIQNEISALFFDSQKTDSYWSHKMDVRSVYRIINQSDSMVEVDVDDIEKTEPKDKKASYKEQFRRKILVDKTTGLILEDNLSFIWNFTGKRSINRYQKLIPAISEKFDVRQKAGESEYEKSEILNTNTNIRISVQDSKENSKFIYLSFFDEFTSSYKSFQLEKDKNGIYNFQMHLDEPQGIILHFSPEVIYNSKIELVSLCPGDNLEVQINKSSDANRLIFKGSGVENNRFMQRFYQLNLFNKDRNIWNFNQPTTVGMDSAYQLLNNSKALIHPELYLETGNTLLYSPYFWKKNSFPDSIDNLKIPFCNSLAIRNPMYMTFLRKYIGSFEEKLRKSSTNYKPAIDTYEKNYSFGQVLFPEPILAEYLANVVEEALRFGDWENSKLLYKRHKLVYSNNPRFAKTEGLYQQQAHFSPGATFPIETRTDIYGNLLNFQREKNKLIAIKIYNISYSTDLVKEMVRWRNYGRNFSSSNKNITNVWIIIGKAEQLSRLKAALGFKSELRFIFLNADDVYMGSNPLSPLLYRGTFVLGRKGTILFNREPTTEQWLKATEDLKKPVIFSGKSNLILKIISITLLGILIIVGLGFIIYRQVLRRKLKLAERNRKMRELELTVIRTQMNPHFMYNCLNSIQNLVQKNQNEEAFSYISKFASLVRQVLNNSKKDEIPLNKELDSVKEYIELEQLRFDFDYKIDIAEGIDVNGIFVPPMLLQPFVENALLHGLLQKKNSRLLKIQILKEQAKITLVIEDNGVGREAAGKSEVKGNGQGILLCRNRLSLLSEKTGIQYELKIDDLTDDNQQSVGTRVSIGFVEEE